MKEVCKKLIGQTIISCQAYEDTPLYGADNMKKMAACAILGGAKAVRSCWSQDIKAIRSLSPDLIIIGIDKVIDKTKKESTYPIITPNFESVKKVVEAGANVVALDCTPYETRGREEIVALLKQIHDTYPEIGVMADTARVEDAKFVHDTGYVDIVGNTLSEYVTRSGKFDKEVVEEYKRQCPNCLVNAEGKIWDLRDMQEAIDAGSDMITIGSAITRPHLITERFIKYNDAHRTNRV